MGVTLMVRNSLAYLWYRSSKKITLLLCLLVYMYMHRMVVSQTTTDNWSFLTWLPEVFFTTTTNQVLLKLIFFCH